MNSIHEQKYKIESEFHIIIRRLVHPQAKDYYDEERENKIIIKTIEILRFKDTCNTLQATIRNYVLKMKVRNKIGLKLSRWVGYTELPKELLTYQEHHHKALQKMKSAYQPNTNSGFNDNKKNNKKKLGKNKSTSSKEELHDLHEQKQREYINFLKVALQRIQKRKNDLREAIESENWRTAIEQSGQGDYIDMQADLNNTMADDNLKLKQKCDALVLLRSYLNR